MPGSTRDSESTRGAPPAYVLIHGGAHTSRCWAPTVDALRRRTPQTTVVTPDLPGRRGILGDLATLTIDECAAAICEQINRALGTTVRIVLVGHSLAGVTLGAVADAIGGDRIDTVVYVATCVPPVGRSVVDVLPSPLNHVVRWMVTRSPVISVVPSWIVQWIFCNHATQAQRTAIRRAVHAESGHLLTQPVTMHVPREIRSVWILPTFDRALPPRTQRRFIKALGTVSLVLELPAGHEVMITHADELADAILAATAPGAH